ncbi:GNAT family N-acetyltransferase [Microlunatus soli]|uniref:Acetyltransferase (GNAT) family protein n=1 Tax=Microlunatus soli TaxID=630515 RepID=A0A1H1R671_9ACTN|nr:GNAT family N-acetyltransferase [Microlunatus soli]SDS31016.1 Acetyltransferase (GNAT) family protein [Microlunatus soli]
MADSNDNEVNNLRIVPANHAAAVDLDTIYGSETASRCRCQWFKLEKKESLGAIGGEGLRERHLRQTGCGHPDGRSTSGLVGYLDEEPVAWVAVEPRPNYPGMLRVYRVPWDGRNEDKTDPSVWAITCLYTRAGYRGRGISTRMAIAAVDFARENGAAAVEAYPITHGALSYERRVGTPATFGAAGLQEVHQPSKRRIVMRLDFGPSAADARAAKN